MKILKSVLIILPLSFASLAVAQTADQKNAAWKIHNRIAGVPPSPQVHLQMAQLISQNPGRNGLERAAAVALDTKGFYNITLKNMFKPLSNQAQSSRTGLNDMVATMIGAVRDSDTKPFSRILSEDLVYTGPSMGRTDGTNKQRVDDGNRKKYDPESNEHYETMEARKLDLRTALTERQASATILTENFRGTYVDGNNTRSITAEASRLNVGGVNGTAGVLTSRQYGLEFFQAGTNRRVTRYTFMNFMCKDFEDLHDTTIPDFRVAKDVDRKPGGDSRVYKNNCVGCHAGQDALRGALSYYDANTRRINFTPGRVVAKMNRGAIYDGGFQTTNDSWINTWAEGKNADLDWRGATSGNGIRAWGEMFARSGGFASCMSQRVFKNFCYRSPSTEDKAFIQQKADEFIAGGYNFKTLVVKTAAKCVEDQ